MLDCPPCISLLCARAESRLFSGRITLYEQAHSFLFAPRKPGAVAYAAEYGAA